jgi:hypothetical protein
MTVIREEDVNLPEVIQEPFDYAEIFDCSRFSTPAECYASRKEIPW